MHLQIVHDTTYRYGSPVSLSQHVLYLRPRENSVQRLHRFTLHVSPRAEVTRVLDPLDNELWLVRFPQPTDHVHIRAESEVETLQANPFDFVLKDYAVEFPFAYEPVFDFALGPHLVPPFDATQVRLRQWLAAEFPQRPKGTVEWLSAINRRVFERLTYRRRDERGIQTSVETLDQGGGACRDYAVLLIELCRTLGIAARFISGYMFAPIGDNHRTVGAMHAWLEVYLPGAGWRPLDPTHGVWCDDRYVPVAHAAQAETVNPIQGSYYGPAPSPSQLCVGVEIERITPPSP